MSRPALCALPVGLLACVLVVGCENPRLPFNLGSGSIGGGIGNADPGTRAACTQRADQIYNQRNRAAIYAPQSSVNAPFSANYLPGRPDSGLSDRYAYDAMIRDCVRNTGSETSRDTPPAPANRPVARQ